MKGPMEEGRRKSPAPGKVPPNAPDPKSGAEGMPEFAVAQPGDGAPDEIPSGTLPTMTVVTLFACALGALIPGVLMTLVVSPGNAGSPLYGLLLPWLVVPYALAGAAGWMARRTPLALSVAAWTVGVALLGVSVFIYGLLWDPKGNRNVTLFLWVPLWQCILLTHITLKVFRHRFSRPGATQDSEEVSEKKPHFGNDADGEGGAKPSSREKSEE